MKKTLILLLGIFLVSCNQKNKSNSSVAEMEKANDQKEKISENFNWLTGKWKRLNEEAGKETFENWKKQTSNKFLGHGFVMHKLDTVWQEKMILSKIDSTWTLSIKTPGNNDLVKFNLVEYDSNSFTAENPAHDFPKKIKYWKNNEQLYAVVEGDSMKIKFDFENVE